MLLFRGGSAQRLAVPLSLVDRLEKFPLAQVEETVSIRSRTSRPGLVGSAVVGGHVTDFIDLRGKREGCRTTLITSPPPSGEFPPTSTRPA